MNNIAYLFLSVTLSVGRNTISKNIATNTNKKAEFFLSQTVLFASAFVLLLFFGIENLAEIAPITLSFGIIYGVLLILSQWMFTFALKNGNTSVCSVVYSLGFILPTVSGALFWNETLTLLNFIGILFAVIIVLLAAKKGETGQGKRNGSFVLYIIIAMISSGGLGIMQKVQQSSKAADEKVVFLLVAFCFAFCCSFVAFLLCRERATFNTTKVLYPAFAGLCFGGANLCNTILAGKMKSMVFFPLQNISTILFTSLLGVFVFKEKITLKTAIILILGVMVVLLFSL